MEAVFGLVEYYGARGFHDGVGAFFAALGGETVHEDGIGTGEREEGVVNLVVVEGLLALDGFLFLTHAGPDVGIDGVGIVKSLGGIVGDFERGAGEGGEAFGLRDDVRVGEIARGAG